MRGASRATSGGLRKFLSRGEVVQRPLQISYKGLASSPALDELIRERVAELERLHSRIVGCRVVVEVPHRGAESAKVPIGVTVEVEVPNRSLVIGKDFQERHEAKRDHAAPLNAAFDAVERQLERINDFQHGDVRRHAATGQTGMVVRLFPDQNYGFVELDNSTELYFTRNAVAGGSFDELSVGMMVIVTPATDEGPMGPQASSVRLFDKSRTPA
jgi:ribosome-associated translation inhibitor RaiA/cold shock CspA family protein